MSPNENEQVRREQERFVEAALASRSQFSRDGSVRHPTHQLLVDYVYDQLSMEERSRLSAHIARCDECHSEVTHLRAELDEVVPALDALLTNAEGFDPADVEESIDERGDVGWTLREQARDWVSRFRSRLHARLARRRVLVGHAAAFVAASGVLFLVNLAMRAQPTLMGEQPTSWWVGWIALPWALVLAVHALYIWRR